MFLKKMIISGFRSYSPRLPQTIEFDPDKTVLIGSNGSGKSAVLDALNKVFSVDTSIRNLKSSDFYSHPDEDKVGEKKLYIDVWFGFENLADDISVPTIIEQLTLDDNEDVIFRVRLEATLNYEFSDVGDIDDNVYIITSNEESPPEESKVKLSPLIRNSIQVHYVPASRDPLKQLAFSSTAILGRLLKATKWEQGIRGDYREKAAELINIVKSNKSLDLISNSINDGWGNLYKEKFIANAELNFPFSSVEDLMKLTQLFLSPNEQGGNISSELLSDGQRSLLYLAIIHALFCIESKIKESGFDNDYHGFDIKKLRMPIFSLVSLEEPENHLSPNYLGRILKAFSIYTAKGSFQMILSTHSTAIMSRVEPSQVRQFSYKELSSFISRIYLPENKDEEFKFINEAVKAYPEIYFSKLVILVEGDSEQVILPRVFECYDYNIDAKNISIAPLGGRHVNHFWRLLESLRTPYITLLDLDLGRNGGGFGRIENAIKQLIKYREIKYINESILDGLPKWDSLENPLDYIIEYDDGAEFNIMDLLEGQSIFFSSPLDIDYLMINGYPEVYCSPDKEYGEIGPQKLKDIDGNKEEIIKAVLKEGHVGDEHYKKDASYLTKFIWYNYRFLSNKSKPASHIRLINKIQSENLLSNIPSVLKRIAIRAGEICDE
ncbi:ATP-dependent nuclease [Pantoea sp. C3]|uniref:ATP-dependent nuclease n=1 Tax=Pantoea phytostimulans TaxID=2769024 RepID=UPI0038F7B21E